MNWRVRTKKSEVDGLVRSGTLKIPTQACRRLACDEGIASFLAVSGHVYDAHNLVVNPYTQTTQKGCR